MTTGSSESTTHERPSSEAGISDVSVRDPRDAAGFDSADALVGPSPMDASLPDAATCGLATGGASILVDVTHVIRTIPMTLFGANIEWIFDADELWEGEGQNGKFDPNEVTMMSRLGVGPFRFPGGIYADNYDWTNGVTGLAAQPRTSLVPTVVDTGRFPNPVGTDEIVALLRTLGAPPPVFQTATVAAGGFSNSSQAGINGLAQLAANWVKYCNNPTEANRAANGHAAPYGVKYWELGNEPYWKTNDQISPSTYGQIVSTFSSAMKAVDPTVQLIAAACQNPDELNPLWASDPDYWNDALLTIAKTAQTNHEPIPFDLLAFHNAYGPQVDLGLDGATFDQVYQTLWAYPIEISEYFASLEAKWRAALGAFPVKLAVTEWGPLFSFASSTSPWFDHGRTLGSALYVASALEAFLRDPNIEVATYFKLSDPVQLGLTTDAKVAADGGVNPGGMEKAVGFVFDLFHNHFGSTLVNATVASSPTYAIVQAGSNPLPAKTGAIPVLDVVSSLSANGQTLYILVVNKSLPGTAPVSVTLSLEGFSPASPAKVFTITGANIDSNDGRDIDPTLGITTATQIAAPTNPQFDAGAPGKVVIQESNLAGACRTFSYDYLPISITVLELTRK